MVAPNCNCSSGFFDTQSNEVNCETCDYRCKNCEFTDSYCTECFEEGITRFMAPFCLCMEGFYDNYDNDNSYRGCVECVSPCQTCVDE